MPDSFIDNPDVVEWPTESGNYWFYGYTSQFAADNDKKRLILCEVNEMADGSLMVVGQGHFIWKKEVRDPQFIPATLPELPKE